MDKTILWTSGCFLNTLEAASCERDKSEPEKKNHKKCSVNFPVRPLGRGSRALLMLVFFFSPRVSRWATFLT